MEAIQFDFCDLNPTDKCPYCHRSNGFDPANTKELLSAITAFSMVKDKDSASYRFRNTDKQFSLSLGKRKTRHQRKLILKSEDITLTFQGDNLLTFNGVLEASRFDIFSPELSGVFQSCPCGETYTKPRSITTLPAFSLIPTSEKILPGRENYKQHAGIEIDMRRGVISPYHDNPFEFFAALSELYDLDPTKRVDLVNNSSYPSKLKRDLAATWSFWGLFGSGREGFENYLDAFCLRYFSPSNSSTNRFRSNPATWSSQTVKQYCLALKEIEARRGQDILKRLPASTLIKIIGSQNTEGKE